MAYVSASQGCPSGLEPVTAGGRKLCRKTETQVAALSPSTLMESTTARSVNVPMATTRALQMVFRDTAIVHHVLLTSPMWTD